MPGPVFLCAGLIEDAALETTELSGPTDPQLVEYCLFPLSGIYRLQAADLEPLPTTTRVTLTPRQRQLVQRDGCLWLILRAGPKTTTRIADSLLQDLRQARLTYSVLQQQSFGTLSVLRIGPEGGRSEE